MSSVLVSFLLIKNDIKREQTREGTLSKKKITEIKSWISEELKNTWQNLFTKQVRFSVARAKNKRKTDNN